MISTLGSWGTKTKDILAEGIKSIIPVMEKRGITRIISLTGHEARDIHDKPNLFNALARIGLLVLARKVLKDGEAHIRLLRGSSLDWTVVRSPVMNEKGSTSYGLQIKLTPPWHTINRNAVVSAMVDLVESKDWSQQVLVVFRK